MFAKPCKNFGIASIGQEYPETRNKGYVDKANTSVQPIVVLKKEASIIVYKITTNIKIALSKMCKNNTPLKAR